MMMTFNSEDVFVLSASCKTTKGANRSILVDYSRRDIHVISNQYFDLIQTLDRKKVNSILQLIDDESKGYFQEFLSYLLDNEFGFITQNIDLFPAISNNINDELIILKDCIIEIDTETFDESNFINTIKQIDQLKCDDLMIKFLSDINKEFVTTILTIINKFDIFCVELHCASSNNIIEKEWQDLIERFAPLSKIFIYASEKTEKTDYTIYRENHAALLIGNIYYIETPLNSNNCGIISQDSLSLNDPNLHNLLKKSNGCLYKKLTIDKLGNIKNCLYIEESFGNTKNNSLASVVNNKEFQKKWFINKDEINTCKDCEFRYNCTDCRAFLTNPNDEKSKPLKCGYNPYTNVWENWSENPLKNL